jgi:hypothetical protein
MILCKNRFQTLVTKNLNALIAPKIYKKKYIHYTVLKLNESENGKNTEGHTDKKTAKQKLLEKLNKTEFIPLENKIYTKKYIKSDNTANIFELKKQTDKVDAKFSIELRDSIAVKLAKLIDKSNVEKTAEDLTSPFKNIEEKKSQPETISK